MGTELIQFEESHKETMTSIEIAEVTGKQHKDVLKSIRNMESSWEKVSGRKFALASYIDAQGKERPCYELTKRECLYVATKFNDEARARLVLRWEQLETENHKPAPMSELEILVRSAQALLEQSKRIDAVESRLESIEQEREESRQLLLAAELSDKELPDESENSKIRSLVNAYVKATGIEYKTAWESIYDTLERRYKKRIKSYTKSSSDKSYLDVAIRHGLGEYLYIIISNMIKDINK